MASADDTDELRGQTPKPILAVIDAVSIARRKSRISLVNEILAEWASQAEHEAVAIQRVLRDMEAKR
jgi:hypothetical protein